MQELLLLILWCIIDCQATVTAGMGVDRVNNKLLTVLIKGRRRQT